MSASEFAVKIQRPLVTNGEPEFLLYNQDRTIQTTIPVMSQSGEDISGYFDPDSHGGTLPMKVYVGASLVDGLLHLEELLPEEPDW